jgi:hypothetical protein
MFYATQLAAPLQGACHITAALSCSDAPSTAEQMHIATVRQLRQYYMQVTSMASCVL